jgi:hypothetical protein
VQVVHKKDHRSAPGQRSHQPGDRLEEPSLGCRLIAGWRGQIRIALPELGQKAAELGEPHVLEQVLRRPLALYPRAQGLDHRAVGQSAGLERSAPQDIRSLSFRPADEFFREARLADARLAQDSDDPRFST